MTRRGGGSRHHPIAFAGFVPLQAASLSGNSRITWTRSETSMAAQRAISSTVRPQPRQSPVRASRVQTLTHGVSIMGSVRIGCEHSQRRQKYNCAIVARLQILGARTEQRSAVQPPRGEASLHRRCVRSQGRKIGFFAWDRHQWTLNTWKDSRQRCAKTLRPSLRGA